MTDGRAAGLTDGSIAERTPEGGSGGPALGRRRGRAGPAEPRRPYHLAVAVGLSTAVYAASLAGVTALQAEQNAALDEACAPDAALLQHVRQRNDTLESSITSTASAYAQAAGSYARLRRELGLVDTELAALEGQVRTVAGGAASLPTVASLPSVTSSVRLAAAAPAPAPVTNATTGASGRP